MAETVVNPKRYGAIDGLRAFSAIGIVLMHVLANGGYGLDGYVFKRIIPSFTDLVFLFMIISGFGMCCGYYDKIVNNKINFGKFYGKRYAKILPFFALLCVVDVIISPSVNSLYEAFANMTLCFGLLPNSQLSVIGVGWFLGVVFLFYLLFPFFCYLLSSKRRAWCSFAVALVFNYLCTTYFFDKNHVTETFVPRSNFLYCAVFFLAGGLIFLYREKLTKIADKFRWLILLLCVSAVVAYYLISTSMPIMLIMFSLFLVYALGGKRFILENPVMKFLSGISMEIYLCHMVIFRVLEKIGLIHLFDSGILSYAVAAVLTIAGAIVFALAAKKGIELAGKLIQNFTDKINKRKSEQG